jgi:hypothetical protein
MMGRWALVLGASVVVCGCQGYRMGSFHDGFVDFAGERRTVGCLDVAVAPLRDAGIQGPAAQIAFGNRCDAATRLDLTAVDVVAYYHGGASVRLEPHDPDGEIRSGMLDGRSSGVENIEYMLPIGFGERPVEMCFDLTGLDGSDPEPEPVLACIPVVTGDAGDSLIAEVSR